MTYGNMKVGRLVLTESPRPVDEKYNQNSGVRSMSIEGQESVPPLTPQELVQRHSDIVAHPRSVVPVSWPDKADRNAFYRVVDSGASLANESGQTIVSDWEMDLERVGSEHEIDFESRLSGPQSRQNDYTVTGERIHCPPRGHYAYSPGASVPSIVTRTSSDGALTVYRGIPVATHPRWASSVPNYLSGRVRFIDANGFERSGTDLPTTPAGWQLHNGLVRVQPSGNFIEVAAWDPEVSAGGAWSPKNWDFRIAGAPLGAPSSVTLLRNEPEMVTMRVMWVLSGSGRATADFTLRRGHRTVEVWVETQTSATIRVQRATNEGGTIVSGYLTAAANDTDGNRYFIGSARTADKDITTGALFKASTRTLGLVIGAVVGGATAQAGDTAADLFAQYVGAASERVEGVRR